MGGDTLSGCDLLKISYLCRVINTPTQTATALLLVVICLKFRIFAE